MQIHTSPPDSIRRSSFLLAALLCSSAALMQGVGAQGVDRSGWPKTLTLSVVPLDLPAETVKGFAPLLRSLEASLGIPVKLSVGKDYAAVIDGLKNHSVDVGYLGAASYLEAHTASGAVAFARENTLRSGTGYFSVIITKTFGPYQSLESLSGKKFAFVDENSTSGYLVPMVYFLRERKVRPQTFFGSVEFSGSHEKSILGVLSGKYDAAAVSSLELQKSLAQGQITQSDFSYLWRSKPIPSQLLAYRPDLPASFKAALKQAFLAYKGDTLTYLKLSSFVAADDSDYDGVRELEEVKASLEKR